MLIYTLLILFAMQFFVVFLSQALEDYYVTNFSRTLESQGLLLVNFLERYLTDSDGINTINAIDSLVWEYSRHTEITDIMVLDAFGRVISSTRNKNELQGQRIIQEEVTRALTGTRSESVRLDPETKERTKYLALPVNSGERNQGVVYLIGSLEPIYDTLHEIQLILLTGVLMVIAITVLLGFFVAKTITDPIQEVTSKAEQFAHGDFRQRINIASDDEIGRLGRMFNYLSEQLETTLQEISSEKNKVEAILNNMTDGIVALTADGELLHVNPTAKKLLALPQTAEGELEKLAPLVEPVDMAVLLQEGKQEEREIVLGAKIIQAYYVPLLAAEETFGYGGVLIVLHDVTQEREMMRIQREFVANVSHELRTPLTTLKSYTETLLAGAMKQEDICRSFLTTMEKETERMVRLVKDLLVLSQLDYRQIGWHKDYYYLNDLIKEVVNDLKIKNKEDPRQIVLSLPDEPLTAYVDRDKMKQVFLNLIQNAYMYTTRGGKINISLLQQEDVLLIEIADNGIGIPAEDLERVFERFYRVDKARSREYGGTGLGLPIAREIVNAHGGTISLQSELNKGTTVTITLPLPAKEDEQCESA